ncbi:unnamed protein product [Pedinophyceae sp. YPF-701]|nr:unnamed protein product [Pedinophyceae sp. YPF-701]
MQPEDRKLVEEAVRDQGGRVTVGDVAARTGLPPGEVQAALNKLAADSAATLEVSASGDIAYSFSPDFSSAIRGKSFRIRVVEPALEFSGRALVYIARLSFGVALFASIAVASAAIVVLMSSGSDRDRERGRGGGGGITFGGGGGGFFRPSMFDFYYLWDPFWPYGRSYYRDPEEMGLFETITSFVFGDGDPNRDYDRKRFAALGEYIQSRGGVLTSDELIAFSDLTPREARIAAEEPGGPHVLPALLRFKGTPEVDPDTGAILYVFPELQTTGSKASIRRPTTAAAPAEAKYRLTRAPTGSKVLVVALGAFNFFLVATLSSMMANPAAMAQLAANGMGYVGPLLPYLQLYALSYAAIPAVRALLNVQRNAAIAQRNEARMWAMKRVLSDPSVQRALEAAGSRAEKKLVSGDDVIYRTDSAVSEQPGSGGKKRDIELEEFDKMLREREQRRSLRSHPVAEEESA